MKPCHHLAIALSLAGPATALAAATPAWDGSEPAPGVYFHWYEPSFYAGFAPRTQDPGRVHLELGRGNQQRLTIVLGPDDLDGYLQTLAQRRDTVAAMVDKGVIQLTTNTAYERFVEALARVKLDELIASREALGADGYRRTSLEVMEQLNPGRVFRLHIPLQGVLDGWHLALRERDNDLDAANAILPERINRYRLDDDLQARLGQARERVHTGLSATDPGFRELALDFLEQATEGRYPVVKDAVEAVEFTAIYPAGTAKAWTRYQGEKLPDFGVTGVWPLIPREHGKGIMGMVDYLSTNPGYGFIPLLGYQYAGGIAYNALHNAGVRSQLDSTPFLPKAWTRVSSERQPGKPYQNLWIGSRGPASHGCTRLPSGHMSELRDALPSASGQLQGIPNFRNRPQCYDLFDIDGDGRPEVMGVKYFLAFWGKDHTPVAAYAPNDRKGFYAWLYKDNVGYRADGSAYIKQVPVCRFEGLKKAVEAKTLHDVPLYEAAYAPETIQFYTLRKAKTDSASGFELNRELRRLGAGHTPDRKALMLD